MVIVFMVPMVVAMMSMSMTMMGIEGTIYEIALSARESWRYPCTCL